MRIARPIIALVVVGVGAVLAGCAGGSPTPSGPTTGVVGPSNSPNASVVAVTETEFSITPATMSFTGGRYTFRVLNEGRLAHNLTIMGPGINVEASPIVQPGATGQVTVTLQRGAYELWCSVDGHKGEGMDVTISVR